MGRRSVRSNKHGEAANMAKYAAGEAATRAVDTAIQVHGGNGMSEEYGLISLWAMARTLRIAPGPARRLALGSPRPPLGREDTSILEALQCRPERLCAAILNDVATGELDELRAEMVGEAAAMFYGREAIVLS